MKKILFLLVTLITLTLLAQSKTYEIRNIAETAKIDEQTGSVFGSSASERIITTSVVFGELAILVLILFYWKKIRTESKQSNNNRYKKNISAIRDERIKPALINKNSAIRKELPKVIGKNRLTAKLITSTAKKLSISKGELFLAAKIQQLQDQTR